MAAQTSIEWTDRTWTPVKGCTRVSEGCRNCYAEILTARFSKPGMWGEGLAEIVQTPHGKDHRWTGSLRFDERELLKPLLWRKPVKIFVCSTSDLFHENVPDEWIDKVFAVMALAPQHVFQVLTKRPERMRDYLATAPEGAVDARVCAIDPKRWAEQLSSGPRFPLPNVWLGTSVEDQKRADERIPILLDTPAAVRWLSCEPLLGPVDLQKLYLIDTPPGHTDDEVWAMKPLAGRYGIRMLGYTGDRSDDWLDGNGNPYPKIDWVVAGGESGPGARPMHPDWARSLRDQCAAAGVPLLFKQWGEFAPCESLNGTAIEGEFPMMKVGKKAAGRLLDGVQYDEYPA